MPEIPARGGEVQGPPTPSGNDLAGVQHNGSVGAQSPQGPSAMHPISSGTPRTSAPQTSEPLNRRGERAVARESRAIARTSPRSESGGAPNYDKSVLFHTVNHWNEQTVCNGGVLGKKPVGGGFCEVAMLSARHCWQAGHNLYRTNFPSGKGYVRQLIIAGKSFVPVEMMETDSRDNDTMLGILKGPCNVIPDSKIAELATQAPGPGQEIYSRKSSFWQRNGSQFQDSWGSVYSAFQNANRLMQGVVGGPIASTPPYYLGFINRSWADTRPGDSGSPVYNKEGQMVGVVSHTRENGPFNNYGFAVPESYSAIENFLARAGFSTLSSTERQVASVGK